MARRIIVSFVFALLAACAAHAEGLAVSGLNGKVSTEAGSTGAGGNSSAIGIAQGSLTAPLGHSFGLQIDGLAATAYGSFAGGGGAHLFWRDPQIGLVGPIAALAGGRGSTVGLYGGEAEFYASDFTLAVQAGGLSRNVGGGGFYRGGITFYPIPDLALSVAGGQFAGASAAFGKIEYQPDFIASRNVAFFVDAAAGDNSFYRATVGVRLYFGPQKTLIRRHREDDPVTATVGILAASPADLASIDLTNNAAAAAASAPQCAGILRCRL